HLFAMFLPSLVSGRIVGALGISRTMLVGTVVMIGCVAMAVLGGHAVAHYWWALVLLGVGWNLLFVAGTTLLTTTYRPAERFRAQAVNEFAVFGSQAVASLMGGVVLGAIGWEWLNLVSLPLLAAMLVGSVLVGRRMRRATA
ncbi:MAG: MFS transporter, partial [Steroidobacteraceae bacterium]|nr:MFS transporter [Steroidobacteraceae bacterium]